MVSCILGISTNVNIKLNAFHMLHKKPDYYAILETQTRFSKKIKFSNSIFYFNFCFKLAVRGRPAANGVSSRYDFILVPFESPYSFT